MKPEAQSFKAILLRKTALSNDDVILEVFSCEYGKVSIFASKLTKSKKRAAEIDFFRLLEFEVQRNRSGSLKLRKVSTERVFHIFSQNYQPLKRGFYFLEILGRILPQEEVHENFFEVLFSTWENINIKNYNLLDLFLRVKTLQIQGVFPRFDLIRGDIYLDPIYLNIYESNTQENIFIPNILRQFLEFLRRSHLQEVMEKEKIFLELDLDKIDKILRNIEEHHSK